MVGKRVLNVHSIDARSPGSATHSVAFRRNDRAELERTGRRRMRQRLNRMLLLPPD